MYNHKSLSHNALRLAFGLCFTAATIVPRSADAQAAKTAARAKDYTAADVTFMQGMIGHHAQAVVMGKMAPTHGASPIIANFCKKVVISQRDEIELMQNWLKDRGEKAPTGEEAMAGHDMGTMGSMAGHDMGDHAMMPGMLTPAQMAQLDKARGKEWDRLFLTFMIQHHQGALTMVKTLFDAPGGGQGPEIFGYATGVDADQRAEIERMEKMLQTMKGKTTK